MGAKGAIFVLILSLILLLVSFHHLLILQFLNAEEINFFLKF